MLLSAHASNTPDESEPWQSSAKLQFFKPTSEMIVASDFASIEAAMLKKIDEISAHGAFMECENYLPMSPLIVAREFPERLAAYPFYKPFRSELAFAAQLPKRLPVGSAAAPAPDK